jgi:hypothetical protein
MWLRNLNDTLSLMFFGCSSRNQEVWVVGFGLVDSLALVPFNLHISFHLFCLVFYSWINPQTFGTRLKWSWLNKTPIFDHFPVDSTSHLHTLYCKQFVRLRVLIKTHINVLICINAPFMTQRVLKPWWLWTYQNYAVKHASARAIPGWVTFWEVLFGGAKSGQYCVVWGG